MINYETLLQKYEQIVQEKFKVKNPYLLKTSALGTLINIFTQQELDIINYYNKLYQESHPALAQDYNSMIFHANFYDVPVNFASPSIYSVFLQIPEVTVDDVYYYQYEIPKNYSFNDASGNSFIIPDKIEIYQEKGKVKAYSYNKLNGKTELNIITSSQNHGNVYLIEYNNVQQYSRNFYINSVLDYTTGNTFNYDISIGNYLNLYKVKAWVNLNPQENFINLDILKQYDTDEISRLFRLQPLNIKFFNYSSTKFDYDIFMNIRPTTINFKTGNGVRGIKLPAGSQIITEIDLTTGANSNEETISANITNILVKKVNMNKKESYFKTNITLFSVTGGQDGQSFESPDSIRKKIFNKIHTRNSLLTEADFENAFEINKIKPFVDARYLNNYSIVYIFNPLKYNNKTIETLATNISEIDLATDPFYPTWTPDPENGKTFISPFYFKRKNENVVDAYIVNPKIPIPLYAGNEYQFSVKMGNSISLYLTYDFNTRKSYLKLENTNAGYTYKLTTNTFSHIFTYGENYTWEIDNFYTDKYCIVKQPIENFSIKIYDKNNNYIMTWTNTTDKIFQLEFKQEIYKYYQKQENNFTLDDLQETVAVEYLDNQLENILNKIEQLYYPLQYDEIPYLLRVPFIDAEFFKEIDYYDFYVLLDRSFKINEMTNMIPLTLKIQQTFYNTYNYDNEIYTKYKDFIFKESTNDIQTPKIPIILNITIDSTVMQVSEFVDSYDLEFDLKLKITDYLLKKEGFQIEFFESELENILINKYFNENLQKSLIKNIDILSPKKFIVNTPDDIYYDIKEKLSFEDLLKFVPPYFYYDYDNIQINISIV